MNDALEIWGGVECSHVRIHSGVRDQLEETGHLYRIDDLDLIAGLGIRTLRYPVLWEMVECQAGSYDWNWTDSRLKRIRDLGIQPIAGLMHHGSGPSWTQILDTDFPEMFARYASVVAQRYPWIELFTPINEPITTARISGLYGLWYPHGTEEATCLRLTVAQCRATARAMMAIRVHVPEARLVQTEDVGRVFATERLAYQADHENERRWLALDLLAGRVDDQHPFYNRLLEAGVAEAHLAEFQVEPCPPDIIGLDYYLTSDRMLDEQIDRYPTEKIGGNGIDTYVDSAAVRSIGQRDSGLGDRIKEVWDRYRLPIVVTELHNGSTRDEQVRWLVEGWQVAKAARHIGIDVRAITAWSLFGAVDWNSMLATQDGYYESGAYDTRAGTPRPTAIANAIANLAKHGCVDHPVLDQPGWWRDDHVVGDSGRHLILIGFGHTISAIQECCVSRRLETRSTRPDRSRPPALDQRAWVTIQVGSSDRAIGTARIVCRYPDGSNLQLQYAQRGSALEVANAVLDLVIDGQRGAFEISLVRPGNQYKVALLSEDTRSNDWAGPERTSNVA